MAEVVRDGNSNCNSSPTFLFGVWGHPRIPRVGEEATTVRESGNQHDRFTVVVLEDKTLCTVSSESLVFVGRPGPLCSLHWWFSARFSTISEAEHPSGACCSLKYSFHLSLFFFKSPLATYILLCIIIFLMLCHSLCCLNFYFCVTSCK